MDDRYTIRSQAIARFNAGVNIKVADEVFTVTKMFYVYQVDWLYERNDILEPWEKCEKIVIH